MTWIKCCRRKKAWRDSDETFSRPPSDGGHVALARVAQS